jgi:hypothetical protein
MILNQEGSKGLSKEEQQVLAEATTSWSSYFA